MQITQQMWQMKCSTSAQKHYVCTAGPSECCLVDRRCRIRAQLIESRRGMTLLLCGLGNRNCSPVQSPGPGTRIQKTAVGSLGILLKCFTFGRGKMAFTTWSTQNAFCMLLCFFFFSNRKCCRQSTRYKVGDVFNKNKQNSQDSVVLQCNSVALMWEL